MEILLTVLNYLVRGMTIVVGVMLVAYPLPFLEESADFVQIFGGLTIVFGIVRLVLYHRNRLKYQREQREQEYETDPE